MGSPHGLISPVTSSHSGIPQESPHSNEKKFQRFRALWQELASKTSIRTKEVPDCSRDCKSFRSSMPGITTKRDQVHFSYFKSCITLPNFFCGKDINRLLTKKETQTSMVNGYKESQYEK
jgi:hypothetical protein